MFDKGEFKAYFDNVKRISRENILAMIDHALDIKDFEWCKDLHKRLLSI